MLQYLTPDERRTKRSLNVHDAQYILAGTAGASASEELWSARRAGRGPRASSCATGYVARAALPHAFRGACAGSAPCGAGTSEAGSDDGVGGRAREVASWEVPGADGVVVGEAEGWAEVIQVVHVLPVVVPQRVVARHVGAVAIGWVIGEDVCAEGSARESARGVIMQGNYTWLHVPQ